MACRTEMRIKKNTSLLESDNGVSFTQSDVQGMMDTFAVQMGEKLKSKYAEIVEISADKELEAKASNMLHRKLKETETRLKEAIDKANSAESKLDAYQRQVRDTQKGCKGVDDINNYLMNDKKFKDDVSLRMKAKEAEILAKYGL